MVTQSPDTPHAPEQTPTSPSDGLHGDITKLPKNNQGYYEQTLKRIESLKQNGSLTEEKYNSILGQLHTLLQEELHITSSRNSLQLTPEQQQDPESRFIQEKQAKIEQDYTQLIEKRRDLLTQLDASIPRKEEVAKIPKEVLGKWKEFHRQYPEYVIEANFPAIQEALRLGLKPNEIIMILTGNFEELKKYNKNHAEKILTVTEALKNKGLLDHYSDAGARIVEDAKEIVAIIRKYGKYINTEEKDGKVIITPGDFPMEDLEKEPILQRILSTAMKEIGVNERDGGADKYLGGLNSRKIPWCAAFVNWVLEQSGSKGNGSNMARSFINETGLGHAGFKVGDKLLGGNQGNKVCFMNVSKAPLGFVIPQEGGLGNVQKAKSFAEIPDGAIVVFGRQKKERNVS